MTRADEIRSLGAGAVYLFGSAARDKLGEARDIDAIEPALRSMLAAIGAGDDAEPPGPT